MEKNGEGRQLAVQLIDAAPAPPEEFDLFSGFLYYRLSDMFKFGELYACLCVRSRAREECRFPLANPWSQRADHACARALVPLLSQLEL